MVCTTREAIRLLEHMDDDDIVVLDILNKRTFQHFNHERIKKKNGEELINRADTIEYQDNDFFGRLSLYGVVKENDIIHNLLFPQRE